MKQLKRLPAPLIERLLPGLVLIVLLMYTYVRILGHPYIGFRWDDQDNVMLVFTHADPSAAIQPGDHLIQLGSTRLKDFQADYRKTLLDGVRPGQPVTVVVDRGGKQITIPWKFPGLNALEFVDQATSEVWLAFVFWLAGTLTLLQLRPKNSQWRLLIAFNYLTATWIAVGGGASFYHLWYSAFLLRICVWFCVPVYLHFHWVFPRALGRLPRWLIWSGYLLACVLALADCLLLLPGTAYLAGFLLALFGSLALLIAHIVRMPDVRRALRFLIFAITLSLVLSIVSGLLLAVTILPAAAVLGLAGLPLIPFAYFYAVYRRQLGPLEVRVNRLIALILFVAVLGFAMITWLALASIWSSVPGLATSIGIAGGLLTALIAVLVFPRFEAFVERTVLGIPIAPRRLTDVYSARITTSTSLPQLLQLLQDEVIPSLLVRQFAFLQVDNGTPKALLTINVPETNIPVGEDLDGLLSTAGKYRPAATLDASSPLAWIRMVLPLKLGPEVICYWLFGRRDPDDAYSHDDIAVIQSLANQTAIALSNILQTNRLRREFEANISRHEEERHRLALDLHDSVLNQMAAMLMQLDSSEIGPQFEEAYDKLAHRLREIVNDLRPPMIQFGLLPAFEELADHLMEQSRERFIVQVCMEEGDTRYPSSLEAHIFQIVQEACENVLKHARAKTLTISGRLEEREIEVSVADDGLGFELGDGLDLEALLANRHFGLAGMAERAQLIGAGPPRQLNSGARDMLETHLEGCSRLRGREFVQFSENERAFLRPQALRMSGLLLLRFERKRWRQCSMHCCMVCLKRV